MSSERPRRPDESTVISIITSDPIAEGLGLIPRSGLYALFTELATLGSLLPAIFMLTAIGVVAHVHHDRPALMLCVLGPAAAVAMNMWVAKPLVDRVREKVLMFLRATSPSHPRSPSWPRSSCSAGTTGADS